MEKIDYPYDTSTVFNAPPATEAAVDEKIGDLLIVDYRYARFALDPRTGLFSMVRLVSFYFSHAERSLVGDSSWRDSSWNGLASIQSGLPPSVRTQRSVLFGSNTLDIQGKSTVSLLIDEVRSIHQLSLLDSRDLTTGHSPVLRIPNCEHSPVVPGRLLLLCLLHRLDFGYQHCDHFDRYQEGRVLHPPWSMSELKIVCRQSHA